jgi:ABC-type multidrug transport system ATPase subunit
LFGLYFNILLLLSYGLLGASGCGKTTLLTCIVGRRKLMSGRITVLGNKPGTPGSGVPGPKVGYMPQVNHFFLSSFQRLTHKNVFYYFCRKQRF